MSSRIQAAGTRLPYENQLLGAFIYALGYESGRTGRYLPVNQFQQTPLDGTFGDLVAGADWCVAFEFKRSWQEVRSEHGKWPSANLQRYLQDEQMQRVAKRAHFLCFGTRHQDQITIGTLRYSAFLRDPDASRTQATQGTAMVNLLVNGMGLTREASPLGAPPEVLEAYLRRLSAMRKMVGNGERPAEWLAVVSSSEGYKFRTAGSLEHLLDESHSRVIRRSMEVLRSRELKKDLDRER